jgi:hypothetical protein
MKSTEYKGYELFPVARFDHRQQRTQIKVYKKGVFQFDTSVCDTIEEARGEAKEAIDELKPESK